MPKQLLKLMGERSSFQETLIRVRGFPDVAPPLVITNETHRFPLAQQAMEAEAPLAGLMTEPVARDTAAAVAVAAIRLSSKHPDAFLLVMPADHHIAPTGQFVAQVGSVVAAASAGRIVIFGTKPRRPSPSFGYIKRAKAAEDHGTHAVTAFVENRPPTKPLASWKPASISGTAGWC